MKRIPYVLAFCGCIVLLVYSGPVMRAAADALTLWWSRVLPSLFPFYVLTSYLLHSGFLPYMGKRLRYREIPAFIMGLVAGFPTGARLAAASGVERAAPFCNLCSPMFLLSVVSIGMCKNAGLFYPLAIAHYGSGLMLLVLSRMLFPEKETIITPWESSVQRKSVLTDIEGGVFAMLKIGGCILFFNVIMGVLEQMLPLDNAPLVSGMLSAALELTSGCEKLAGLSLPLRLKAALLAGAVSFGGICIYAQAGMVAELKRPLSYLFGKMAQACLAFLISYGITPLFVAEGAEVFSAGPACYRENAVLAGTLVAAACIGLLCSYLGAAVIQKFRSKPAPEF